MNKFKAGDRVTAADTIYIRNHGVKPGTGGGVIEAKDTGIPYRVDFDNKRRLLVCDSDLLPAPDAIVTEVTP